MVGIAQISPYLYCSTTFFACSAISSDLLFIRFSLTGGFLFLILASLSGQSSDGRFTDIPLADGIIDIPMFVNMILFSLNLFICMRLMQDERPFYSKTLNEEEMALFRFFQSRCGVTPLQFKEILTNGQFLQLPANTDVPKCGSTLYLVLEGKVSCKAKFQGNIFGENFVKRSGEFFDIKLFNLFSLPVGFDNVEFQAKTLKTTKFFCWDVYGMIAMRETRSPSLKEYWEYMVMRALTGAAIRHHLKGHATLYDSLLIPEHEAWLEGAPSRDFWKREKSTGNWQHCQRQWNMIRSSLLNIIPPKGVRQRPGIPEGRNPKQAYLELLCKTAAAEPKKQEVDNFRFLKNIRDMRDIPAGNDDSDDASEVKRGPPFGLFCTTSTSSTSKQPKS